LDAGTDSTVMDRERVRFTYADGQPLQPQYVTWLSEKLRVQEGLPKMPFHGQRHQASLQLAAGTHLAVVSKRLGHSSVAVTADIYSHPLGSTEHDAANAAAALVPARPEARAHTQCTHTRLRTRRRRCLHERKAPLTCTDSVGLTGFEPATP
jgi:Phage integrase family